MKKGFTLVEILVTIVVLAVLAGGVMVRFSKTRGKVDQRQAEAFLRAMRVSQKMYYARFATYACPGGGCSTAAIKTNLGTEIKDGTYTFTMTANSATTTFTAKADTAGTANDITIDQDGNFTKGGSAYTPP
jgi:prepilin-type N-terminal cleavage/methylation domain-containing protein